MDEQGWKILKWMAVCFALATIGVLVAQGLHEKKKEDQRWERFKSEHNCLLIAQSFSGNVGYKQAWFCNDAVTYYR